MILKKIAFFVFLSCFLFLFVACQTDQEKYPDVSHIEAKVSIVRLDKILAKAQQKAEIEKMIAENGVFKRDFQSQTGMPDSVLVEQFWTFSQNPKVDTLYQRIEEYYGDLAFLEKELAQSFRLVKYYYPDYQIPKVYTILTGNQMDLHVGDSLIVIGLDYFLGARSPYRNEEMPAYMLRRFSKEAIVPSIMLFLSNKYNETDPEDRSMLAQMIYHGKANLFVRKTSPLAADSTILGYKNQELIDLEANNLAIWAHFVEKNLFYETSRQVQQRYISERPFTGEISQECPGRVGRWLGWQIVRTYFDRKEKMTLPELMKNNNARQIFEQSKYKPKE